MIVSEVFHYTTSRWDWIDCNVNQMWIEEIEQSPDCYSYVAVAYNPRKDSSMVMSEPRCYADTLAFVRIWCNSFCVLPNFSVAV